MPACFFYSTLNLQDETASGDSVGFEQCTHTKSLGIHSQKQLMLLTSGAIRRPMPTTSCGAGGGSRK